MRNRDFGIVAVAILAFPGSALASPRQDLPPPPPGISSQLQGLFGGAVQSGSKTPGGAPASTKFKSSGKLVVTDAILGALQLDKTQEAEMRKFVPQLVGAIEEAYIANGFEKHDLGVALAALLQTCHEINIGTFVLEETDEVKREAEKKRLRALVAQVRRAIGGGSGFGKIPDKDKQSAYEMCTFQLGFLAVNWQQAGEDAEKREAVRQTARQLLTSLFAIAPDGIVQSKTGEVVAKAGASVKPADPPNTAAPALQASVEAAPVAPPTNWVVAPGKDAGSFRFGPNGLTAQETFFVSVSPLQNLGEKTIDGYLVEAIARDPFGLGKTPEAPKVRSTSDNAATALVNVSLAGGAPGSAVYIAQTLDRQTVRLSAIVSSSQEGLIRRHQPGVQALLASLMAADKKAAVEENRGLSIDKLPTDIPKWLVTGGPLQPGIYVGNEVYGKETRARLRLYLFPSGEYQLYNAGGGLVSDHSSLNFKYNPRTGLLDMDWGSLHHLSNDKYDPDDDMCLYGKDAQGKPVVYARSDRGFNYSTTILRYEGPLDRPSPADEKAKKAAAEAEARRYKWVTAPGKGIQTAQIQCLLLHSETTQFYNGTGMSISTTYDPYIVLKDGTIYNGLPVAPDDMDLSRSRRQEPEKWGRWKKNPDGSFAAAWPDFPAKFISIKGEVVFPAPDDLRFLGRYGSGETSGSILGSSYRLWGVTFTAEGRFQKDERGGYGSNAALANTPGSVSINTGYDDEGSFVGASGESFALSNSTKKRPKTDRAGSYSVRGYTITLKLDNGGVVRLPFFFADKTRKSMWFEGAVLSKDDEKK